MVTLQRVQDQAFVRLGDLRVRESLLVGQVHLSWDRERAQTGGLRVELQVNGFGRLNSHDELITADVGEDALCDVLELDPDIDLGFVES